MASGTSNPDEPNWDYNIVISWNPESNRLQATAVTKDRHVVVTFPEGRMSTCFAEIKRRLEIGETNG